MAYSTGTATTWKSLLADLRTFAVANGWTSVVYTTNPSSTVADVLLLRGPGPTATEDVFVLIQAKARLTGTATYWWEIRSFPAYDAALALSNQVGISPPVYQIFWVGTIPYRIALNDRRIMMVSQVDTTFRGLYAGFFLPFATPLEYPYPLYIGACTGRFDGAPYLDTEVPTFQDDATRIRNAFDPGDRAAYVREPDGVWEQVFNHQDGSGNPNTNYDEHTGIGYYTWPYFQGSANSSVESLSGLNIVNQELVPNTLPLIPIHIFGSDFNAGVLGILEGAFFAPGAQLSSGQQLTIGSTTYRAFPSLSRLSAKTFTAIEES